MGVEILLLFYVLRSLLCFRNVLSNIESSSKFLTLQFNILNHNFLHLKIQRVIYTDVFDIREKIYMLLLYNLSDYHQCLCSN